MREPGGPRCAEVAVIVVTHNSETVVGGLLASMGAGLRGVGRFVLIVVDNGSRDGTRDLVRSTAPTALLVEMGNVGYAAAINEGIRRAPGAESYLILNPDVRLGPHSVGHLLAALRSSPALGIAVPVLRDESGRVLPSLRREPTLLRCAGSAVLGRRAARYSRMTERIEDPAAYERPTTADWATGAAMLISGRCLAETGPWDESFFLYSEETDFALRARKAGWQLQLVPSASVSHRGGEAKVSPLLHTLLTVNRLRLYRRNHALLPTVGFWTSLVLNEALRAPTRPTSRSALRRLLSHPMQPPFPPDAMAPGPHPARQPEVSSA